MYIELPSHSLLQGGSVFFRQHFFDRVKKKTADEKCGTQWERFFADFCDRVKNENVDEKTCNARRLLKKNYFFKNRSGVLCSS